MSGPILYYLFPMFISMFLLPSAVQRKAILGNAPGDSRHTCTTISVLYFDLCDQGCCGCYVKQFFVGDGVGPKYSKDLP